MARQPGVGLGDDFGCRLGGDGSVRCWGENDGGELGQGDKDPRAGAVRVEVPEASRLAVTRYGSCVLTAAGALHCWGPRFGAKPKPIALPEPAVDIVSGGMQLCLRLESGKLVCASSYRFAEGDELNALDLPAGPFASGDNHVCALADGRVYCSGENRRGQLGLGRGRDRVAGVEPVLGLSGVAKVFAAKDGSCAVTEEGKLWCWGALPNGEWSSPHPVSVPPVASLALGAAHACAVVRDGSLWCWGENRAGQLGDGTDELRAVPVRARGLDDVETAAVGYAFSCATRRDGSLWCWGDNRSDRLAPRAVRHSIRPVRIDGLAAASAITVSRENGCAALRGGGVRCWGGNSQGLFDTGGFEDSYQPVASLNLRDMQSLSLNDRHACGIDGQGAAWCWGQPDERLGVGLRTPQVRMTRRQALAALTALRQAREDPEAKRKDMEAKIAARKPRQLTTLSKVVAIGTGNAGACARDDGGRVWCWGRDGSRVLRARPARVAGLRRAEDLSVGSGFACAVEQGGTVACWGDNDRAQLGDGSKTARALPVRVVGLDDATAVAAGSSHACARRRDGHAVCWGNNDRGQLGGGAAGEASAALVEVGVLDDAARLALGEDHSCALDVGGKVWCWGSNARGQLGLGHTRHVTTPAHVQGIADVTAIAAGDEVTCALCRDGSVWCWGAFLPPLRGAWSPIATSL